MKKESSLSPFGARKLIYAVILVVLALPSMAQSPREALETLLSSPAINREKTAVYIGDLDSHLRIASYQADSPITPASVMKCVTTAALGQTMPYSGRLSTKVYLCGTRDGDTFTGSILVEGAGDPSFGDNRHKDQSEPLDLITQALLKEGIKDVNGEIRIDDSLFSGPAVHPSWTASDAAQAYGTGVHAFNYAGNASGKKSISNPAAAFRNQLITRLKEAGISFTSSEQEAPKAKKKLLVAYASPQLETLMRSCMFRSDNLYAEAFMRLFGLSNGADGSPQMSAEMAMQHWEAKNFPTEGVEIVDGSGLSRDNSLTALFLGEVLEAMKDDPTYVSFFPLAGEEGTVRNFMKDTPLAGRLALKTGSMNGIQSYAGYLLDADYMPTHVVVVITNGMKNRGQFREALSKYLLAVLLPE